LSWTPGMPLRGSLVVTVAAKSGIPLCGSLAMSLCRAEALGIPLCGSPVVTDTAEPGMPLRGSLATSLLPMGGCYLGGYSMGDNYCGPHSGRIPALRTE